jgi:hypothetical protein
MDAVSHDAPEPDAPEPDAAPAPDAPLPPDAAQLDAAPPIVCGPGTPALLATGSTFLNLRTHATNPFWRGPAHIVLDGTTIYAQDPMGAGAMGDRIFRVLANGAVSLFSQPPGASWCTNSQIARDPSGFLYVFDVGQDQLWKIDGAGSASLFSDVGGVGGGSNCSDSGVIGLLARPDGSFFVGSPSTDRIYTLSADGMTRTDFADVADVVFLDGDGAGGIWLASSALALVHVSAAGTIMQTIPTPVSPRAVRVDPVSGALYFVGFRSVFRVRADASIVEELACLPGGGVGLAFGPSTAGAGAPSSLYVTAHGATIDADDGDAIFELQR